MNRNSDYRQFSTLWAATLDTYERKVSVVGLKLAFAVLAKWSLNEITAAIESYMSDPDKGHFAPKPADIVRAIIGGGAGDFALLAWSRVEKSIRCIGPWQSVSCDDPLILVVVRDMGGWMKLCNCSGERELIFVAKEFVSRYAAYAARGKIADDSPTYLPGIQERECIAHGFPDNVPSPVAILGSSKTEQPLIAHSGPEPDSCAYRMK